MFHEYTPEEIGRDASFAMNLKMVSSKMSISRATPSQHTPFSWASLSSPCRTPLIHSYTPFR